MKHNVLIIHVDQLRCDCIGAYGNKEIKTPNIDLLAQDSIKYTNSFCSYPVCTPSRYSLLTGVFPHQHMGWNNCSTVSPHFTSFPKVLREEGYQTYAVGKMHFTPTYLDLGFSNMYLSEQDGDGRYDDDYHRELMAEDKCDTDDIIDQIYNVRKNAPKSYFDSFGAKPSNLEEKYHSTTWIAENALAVIENWQGESELMMVGFIKPHHPFDAPAPWCEMYDPEELSLLPGWTDKCIDYDLQRNEGYFKHTELNEQSMKKVMSQYYASISQIDFYIGKMMELLKNKGLYNDTIIIFTSDHGDYMGFHHMILKANYMYDPLMRIPLLIKYPNSESGGQTCSGLNSNVDVAPTILQNCGCEIPKQMKGMQLKTTGELREFVFAESDLGNEYMVRSKNRKLLYNAESRKNLFFDVEKDPYELQNQYQNIQYENERNEFVQKLSSWSLFETKPEVYLDYRAPVVCEKSRESIEAAKLYYKEKINKTHQIKWD